MIAVEPEASPVLSGGPPGPHKIQGIGAGFVPAILDRGDIDEVVTVSNEDSVRQWRGTSPASKAFRSASRRARPSPRPSTSARAPENAGKTIVVIIPSFAERYLSTALFEGLGA